MRSIKGILIGIVVLSLAGCMTANQLEAEKAYYEHLTAISAAQQARPLFKMIATDATKPIIMENVAALEVYAPPALNEYARQYQHRDFTPAWVPPILQGATTVGLVYGLGWGFKKVLDSGNGATYNQNVTGTGNTATIRQAGNTSLSGGITGNSNMVGGMIDNTSPPTVMEPSVYIVEQPAPVIVTTPTP